VSRAVRGSSSLTSRLRALGLCFLAIATIAPCSANEDTAAQPCPTAIVQALSQALLPSGGGAPTLAATPDFHVCKAWAVLPGHVIGAATYKGPGLEEVTLAVSVWREQPLKLTGLHQRRLEQDASLSIDRLTLRIDTARYALSTESTAFGIDTDLGYWPHCGDGLPGPMRTLYTFRAGSLLPLALDLSLSHEEILQGRKDRCASANSPESKLPELWRKKSRTIGVARSSTNGLRDLRILELTRYESSEGAKLPKSTRTSFTLKFDGKTYVRQP
jgi:hypothetical protein